MIFLSFVEGIQPYQNIIIQQRNLHFYDKGISIFNHLETLMDRKSLQS